MKYLSIIFLVALTACSTPVVTSSNPTPSPTPVVDPEPSASPTVTPTSTPQVTPSPIPTATPTATPIPATVYYERPPSVPACSIWIDPSSNIQSTLNATGKTIVCLKSGTYRVLSPIHLNANQTLYGDTGAIISGATVLAPKINSTYSSTLYTDTVPSINASNIGTCLSGTSECTYPNDVYLDNVPLARVLSLASVAAGTYYVDPSTKVLYMKDNPSGHVVEYSSTAQAFSGSAPGSIIEGLVIEKFSNDTYTPAVSASGAQVLYNEIRLCHGPLVFGTIRTAHNWVHDGRFEGVATPNGYTGAVFGFNEISHNNTAGYDYNRWAGGGSKFWQTVNTVARSNYVHDNNGRGLWDDTQNSNITYDNNLIVGNASDGIEHEVSNSATITNNTLKNNGWKNTGVMGCAITITSSDGSTVSGNTLTGNHGGICLIASNRNDQGTAWILKNNKVTNNSIEFSGSSGYTGLNQQGTLSYDPFTSGNVFSGNTYQFNTTVTNVFYWKSGPTTYSQWQALGNQ